MHVNNLRVTVKALRIEWDCPALPPLQPNPISTARSQLDKGSKAKGMDLETLSVARVPHCEDNPLYASAASTI